MRILQTQKTSMPWIHIGLSAEDRVAIGKLSEKLVEPETSELRTGELIDAAMKILEPYRGVLKYLNSLPFTIRTAYRRKDSYARAIEIWPKEIVDAAIKRNLKIVGWKPEKPMGLFEDVEAPAKNLTAEKIEEYLNRAELLARRAMQETTGSSVDAYSALKQCFRFVERTTRRLSPDERAVFLEDLVGLEMTLLGANLAKVFTPAQVPQDFWMGVGGYSRSAKTRSNLSKAALERWKRDKAKAPKSRNRS